MQTVSKTPQQRRDKNDEMVRLLANHYPKCFFEDQKRRLPLKLNILADIKKDTSFDHTPEQITAGVEWYITHIGYDYVISGAAGARRIDLDGREVGTVTEQEAWAAQQRVYDKNKDKNEAAAARGLEYVEGRNPIPVLNKMRADNQIPDDIVKKQDAPPMTHRAKTTATVAPEFAPLYEDSVTVKIQKSWCLDFGCKPLISLHVLPRNSRFFLSRRLVLTLPCFRQCLDYLVLSMLCSIPTFLFPFNM